MKEHKLEPLNNNHLQNHLLKLTKLLRAHDITIQQFGLILSLDSKSGKTLSEINRIGLYSHKCYLYAVLKQLQARGLIVKVGLRYYATGKAEVVRGAYLNLFEGS